MLLAVRLDKKRIVGEIMCPDITPAFQNPFNGVLLFIHRAIICPSV